MEENYFLKSIWKRITSNHGVTDALQTRFWEEIESAHTAKNRYYHTLSTLQNKIEKLISVQHAIDNLEVVLFALYYVDFYQEDTEERNLQNTLKKISCSLTQLNIEPLNAQLTRSFLEGYPKEHSNVPMDYYYFLDINIAVMGVNQEHYELYLNRFRKEYSFLTEEEFAHKRKNFLTQLMQRKRLFYTDFFFNKFERNGQNNLKQEWKQYWSF